MFAGMPVRGAIATESHAALLTGSQMNPSRTDLYAFFTFAPDRVLNRRDGGNVGAGSFGHGDFKSLFAQRLMNRNNCDGTTACSRRDPSARSCRKVRRFARQ